MVTNYLLTAVAPSGSSWKPRWSSFSKGRAPSRWRTPPMFLQQEGHPVSRCSLSSSSVRCIPEWFCRAQCVMMARRVMQSSGRTSCCGRLGQPRNILMSIVLACCCKTTASLPWHGPQVTVLVKNRVSALERSPRPTPKPEMLFKRQTPGPDTCGFINGDIGNIPWPSVSPITKN